jgi:IclR family transcriptional regulator, acetate operon repressor
MKRNEVSAVKSLDRGLDILEYVAGARKSPSFSRMMVDLEIPRSSLFHLLNNLQERGFITRNAETDGYQLGEAVSRLARALPETSLGGQVLRQVQQLSAELNETCGFYVRVGDEVEVVASAISTQALTYTMKVGARAPLYAVSAGKIVLAEFQPDELKAYLGRIVLKAATPQTILSKRRLRQEIDAIRGSGFAYSHEEFTPGISAVATAVRRGGEFLGALNIAVPTVRFTPQREAMFRDSLRVCAQTIVSWSV